MLNPLELSLKPIKARCVFQIFLVFFTLTNVESVDTRVLSSVLFCKQEEECIVGLTRATFSESFFVLTFFSQFYWLLLLWYTIWIYNTTQKQRRKRKKKQKPKRGRYNGTNVPCEAPLFQAWSSVWWSFSISCWMPDQGSRGSVYSQVWTQW